MASIYAHEHSPDSLLLVKGQYVVNGDYTLERDSDGVLRVPNSKRTKVVFVMEAPKGTDYEDVLDKAHEIIKARNAKDSTDSRHPRSSPQE
jgi:hypothetical protein